MCSEFVIKKKLTNQDTRAHLQATYHGRRRRRAGFSMSCYVITQGSKLLMMIRRPRDADEAAARARRSVVSRFVTEGCEFRLCQRDEAARARRSRLE
jgi:hypothetical protein